MDKRGSDVCRTRKSREAEIEMSQRRVVLITGCSSGFGYLTAKLLTNSGYRVYAGVRKTKDLGIFGGATKTGSLSTVLLDVTWPQKRIDKIVKGIEHKEGRIDVLVNNAGFGFFGTVGSFSEKEISEQFETNAFGLFKMTKAVLPFMREKRVGTIVNISSSAGLFTSAYYGVYSASKFAVEALTTALRAEESLYGIHAVAVNPGSFETKFWQNGKFPKTVGDLTDSPATRLAKRIRELILKSASRRGNPMVVARKIKEIIETKNPKKNYLIGWDAILLYWVSRLFPQSLLDWLVKKVVKRLA